MLEYNIIKFQFSWRRTEILMMPVSVQVHHSFDDGIHIGGFVNALDQYLGSFAGGAEA